MMWISSIIFLLESHWLWSANLYFYHALNDMAGQSFVFDKLLGLGLSSNLVKAGVIGACFMFAWLTGDDAVEIAARRKILLITLVSSVFVLTVTKPMSKAVFLPRPFVLSERSFHLEGDQLVETPRIDYNVPFDEDSQKTFRELKHGQIAENDLGTFPSDHAGFFITIAFGIFLAYRRAGLLAVLWTIFVPIGAKLILGQHFPMDILASVGIGALILFALQTILGRWGNRVLDPVADWTLKNSALSAALLFIVLFEATSTLDDVRQIGKVGKDVAKHMIGRP